METVKMSNDVHFNVRLNCEDTVALFSKIGELISIVRPEWHIENLQFEFFTEGLTNKLICCGNELADKDDRILFAIFGENTEMMIERSSSLKNIKELSDHGLASPIYCTYTNGVAYKYVPGITLGVDSIREDHISKLAAKCMAHFHSTKLNFETHGNGNITNITKPAVYKMIKKFMDAMPDKFPDPYKQLKFESKYLSKPKLKHEYKILRQRLEQLKSPIVFCHNDVFAKNFIYDKKEDCVKLIDFEYCDYNYQAYDIADHFTEYAGCDNIDFNRYPNKEYQIKWLTNYLNYYHEYKKLKPPTEKQIETLYVQVNVMAAAPHFVWSIWAIVQSNYSTIDFDYLQ